MSKVKKINFIFLMTFLAAILVGGIFTIMEKEFDINVFENYFLNLIIYQSVLILPTLIYIIINKLNIKEFIRFKKVKIANVFLIILFAYLISPVMSLLNQISMLFATNYINDTVRNALDGEALFLGLLFIAFIPCVFEEIVYRGAFFNEYRKVNTLKGILLSGFLFGLMHLNINQFIYAASMGIIFAFLIEATDSILASMITHFVINGTSVLLVYMLPKFIEKLTAIYPEYGKELSDELLNVSANAISKTDILSALPFEIFLAAISGFLAFIVFKNIAKNSGRWEHIKSIFKKDIEEKENTQYKKEKIMTPALAIAIAACISYMIVTEYLLKYII